MQALAGRYLNKWRSKKYFKKVSSYKYTKDLLMFIIIFLLVAMFVRFFTLLLYDVLIDEYVIDNSFFLTEFNNKMSIYSFAGYAAACVCFTSYLLLAQKVNQLNDDKGGTLKTQENINKFYILKSAFKNAFALSALILSLFIIWLGTMFNAVNSLELMEYYHQISATTFFNGDFIYLVGLMHSLLLLIFYVPVHIAFNSISIVEEQKTETTKNLTDYKKGLVGFFQTFSSVLITASPLMTSLIQGLIDNFFKD